MTEAPPSQGYRAIIDHWKDDLGAAASVSLVALPLGLGIALASGVPPMAGILSAIVGGILTTFTRGSYIAINGPTASLIVVVLTGVQVLGDGGSSGYRYVLAAIVIAGAIQAALGLLKMGKLGDLFPSSVITGLLATIGIIIFVKQFHVALGVRAMSDSSLGALLEIPTSLLYLNPWVTFISLASLLLLIVHPQIHSNFIKSIPAPLLVLVVSILLVFVINLFGSPELFLLGDAVFIGNEYLVQIPENLLESIVFPDFSKVNHPYFWILVISIVLIASIETLVSAKAVDKLDHYKRRTDLNRDLFGVGVGTVVSGMLGGLPVITVIVRSSVNVNHNAKTKWSNFYHGVLLLAFIYLFPFLVNEIPLACLATILVYSGYKLASPRVFHTTLLKGWEQLLILIATMIASLAIDLIWGILTGVIVTLLIQWLRSGLHIRTFFRHLRYTEVNVIEESKENVHVEIKGIANFAIMLRLINSLTDLNGKNHCVVDFSRTKLVDSTVLDFIHDHREKYFTETEFEFTGLDRHKVSSPHPLALHILDKPMQRRLTHRQHDLYHFAQGEGYRFSPEINWDVYHFEKFNFFEFHLLDYHCNRISGSFEGGVDWVISDVTYNDGILMAREEHQLTVMHLRLDRPLNDFSITKENVRQMKTLLRKHSHEGDSLPEMDKLTSFLSENASYYIEGVEKEVFIYRKERLLSSKEVTFMCSFARDFLQVMPKHD